MPSRAAQMQKPGWVRLQVCVLGFVSRGLYRWTRDIEATEHLMSVIILDLSGNSFTSIAH